MQYSNAVLLPINFHTCMRACVRWLPGAFGFRVRAHAMLVAGHDDNEKSAFSE